MRAPWGRQSGRAALLRAGETPVFDCRDRQTTQPADTGRVRFCVDDLARMLALSPRHIQRLLHEEDTTLSAE